MPDPTQTAVIIPVGPAEALVGDYRRRLDVAASWGVPAHATVLYPFVSPAIVDDHLINRLAGVFAAAAPFDCTFDACGWFGKDVLWLAPDDDRRFRDLNEGVASAFPEYPPYGGEHDDVVPHLTVGHSRPGTVDDLRAAAVELAWASLRRAAAGGTPERSR